MALSVRESMRETRKFLSKWYVKKPGENSLSPIRNWKWGYVIYRTVYTPESDSVWDSVVSKLEAYMYREVDRELWWQPSYMLPMLNRLGPLDATVNAEIREHMQNHVLSDKMIYDDASLDQIRDQFKDFLQSWSRREDQSGRPHDQFCIVIDDEVLQSLVSAAEPDRDPEHLDLTPGFVKIVDKKFDPNLPGARREREDFEGWMKGSIIFLWELFMHLDLEDICPYRNEETGEFPIYDTSVPTRHSSSQQPILHIGRSHVPTSGGIPRGTPQNLPLIGTQRGPPEGIRDGLPGERRGPPRGTPCKITWPPE